MRFLLRLSVLSLAVMLFSSCGQKSAGLQEGAVAPDQQLFETGMQYLEKSQFIKARLAFQTLVNTYPDSEHTPASFLAIADSFYKEAGTTNLLQAETQYKDFIIFYPTHEIADDAQMKIAAVNVRLMREPDRDSTYAIKAERELIKFLEIYPDSELAPTADEFLWEVQENLADGIQGVGDFYFTKDSHLASESRFKEVLDRYPDYSGLSTTLYRLGQSLEGLGRVEEATVYYSRLVPSIPLETTPGTPETSWSCWKGRSPRWMLLPPPPTRRKPTEESKKDSPRWIRFAECGRSLPAGKTRTKWLAGVRNSASSRNRLLPSKVLPPVAEINAPSGSS